MPGRSVLSALRTRTSVRSVREAVSSAPEALATTPSNGFFGNSRIKTCTRMPGTIAVMNVWGTLTKTRRSSVWARRNMGVVALVLPAPISAPASTKRTVMTPAKGARTRWKPWSSSRRCTLARLASTLACAAITVDCRVDRRLRDGLDAAGQHEIRRARPRRRLDHGDDERAAPGRLHRLGQLGVALDARHDADGEEHSQADQTEESQAEGAPAARARGPRESHGTRLR